MNRNRYRLVFNPALNMMVPVAETSRGRGKAASGPALALVGMLAGSVQAEVPVPAGAGFAAPGTTASYQANGVGGCPASVCVTQVGNKAIMNWDTFNLSKNLEVQFRQVNNLIDNNLVQGANFTSLNRIHDLNPSIIAGSLTQAAGQNANVILVNTNGIAFMGGSQVNLNSFTASTLNIKDTYILDSFLGNNREPQFEGTTGFIKIFEGAQITAGSQGRVMLIAPTVVNKGSVKAADGQVITAAATKVYLRSASIEDANVRGLLVEVDSPADLASFDAANPDVKEGVLDGQAVNLTNPAEDKLGHVTNLSELTTPRGNVTMVGYAVNQLGIARATTSVVSNGSVYLLAKDRPENLAQTPDSARAGSVVLGANSLTEVLPDVADGMTGLDGTTGSGLAKTSQVWVMGQDVRMAAGAVIHAPAGDVRIEAVDDPSRLPDSPTFGTQSQGIDPSNTARLHIASGARIDVAGIENVAVSAARNAVEVELRGDELKDSPVNQQGPLRGEKVYLDVNRALAQANAGKSTLIAKDSLESYQARLERTVAERSTQGGTVSVRSQGEAILESGAVVDLSGGSVRYTAANVKTTILSSNGALTDLTTANGETRYDGIATRYVRDYGRWNVREVIDLGQSFRYDPGYVEGKNAGALDVIGMKAMVMQAEVQGRTTTGDLQREAGTLPSGARLTLGTNNAGEDHKLNQRIEVSSTGALLPAGFKFGDAMPQALKDTLSVNPNLLGDGKVAHLEIFGNQVIEVREAMRTSQGGSVNIIGADVNVNADIEAAGGAITLAARNNAFNTLTGSHDPQLTVADGVTLSARGAWINELPGVDKNPNGNTLINGGKILLSAQVSAESGEYVAKGTVRLGQDTLLDVTGGGRIQANGKVIDGQGGDISLAGYEVKGIAQNLRGYATGKGGKLRVSSLNIKLGGDPDNALGTLNLDTGFVERGGFADYKLIALDTLTVADGAQITPTVMSLELQPHATLQASGNRVEIFSRVVKRDDRVHQAANLTLAANRTEDGGDTIPMDASATGLDIGNIRVGTGAQIQIDPKASITLFARKSIDIQGHLVAHGGTIQAEQLKGTNTDKIWLGDQAKLDVSGVARTYTDNRGLTQGEVLAGGKVNLQAKTGYVVTQAGSHIDVSGAAPVRLDTRNEAGSLGRMVGSDAGTLTVFAEEGLLLDGALAARAGSPSNRGGMFNATLSKDLDNGNGAGFDSENRVLSLAQTLPLQTPGLTPDSVIPSATEVRAQLSATALENAGFDRVALSSRDAIQLEDGLNLGASRALPIREVKLDAARILTTGGNANLTAEAIRLGNYDLNRRGGDSVTTDSGSFTANAKLIEVAGDLRLGGMARAVLNGAEQIRFSGVKRFKLDSADSATTQLEYTGSLKSAADLIFHGAVVAPTTYTQFQIQAAGKSVEFTRNTNTPTQPFSALGSLTVEAQDIVQNGNLWAPFGQLNFNASNTLTFKDGSITSVSAAPGSLIPFGKVQNGRAWVYDLDPTNVPNGQITQPVLGEKSIRMTATTVDMQAGAKISLAGGGDLQAYEFTVGPGGSRDILSDANVYAILPGYVAGFAPQDAQEKFDRAPGDSVYLSGVPQLADGTYTLLPAHYALLPGAYAVRVNTGIKDLMPGQSYSRQDGVRVASGYLTDNRAGAPRDARWSGFEVLTRAQVLARSEITLTRASSFFADARNRPQDAGLLSIASNGIGSGSLKFDAIYDLAAGEGGRGASVDFSALKLAVVSGAPAGIASDVTQLEVDKLNALGAESLFIGGTRRTSGDTTTLTVGAETVTLANDADHAFKAPEIILAAKDTVTLKARSVIDAQGDAGNAGHYETEGEGALVRAASTSATFARTGSVGTALGTLTGEAGSKIIASDSITLDATRENAFKGTTEFTRLGKKVAGNLGVGASRINFGTVTGPTEGITYSQADLDAFSSLKDLTLTSYSTFDLYSDVRVGGTDTSGKPTLQNLSLQGAGLAGINNSGKTATLNAQKLTLSNPSGASYAPGGTLGDGTLKIVADTLTLGKGDKAIQGFSNVTITANELLGQDIGTTSIEAPLTLNVARISGARSANQTLTVNGEFTAAQRIAERTLAPVTALGAQWAFAGTSVDFNTRAVLPSGQFKLTATGGDVTLGANADMDVAGRTVRFFDVSRPTLGGTAEFVSDTGNVSFEMGSRVDISAAAGGDAGTLIVQAQGTASLADGSVQGDAPLDGDGQRGEGARVEIDTGTLASFSTLNTTLNTGTFDGERKLRVGSGDVYVAATDKVKAKAIHIAADNGKLNVAGQLDASGEDAGRIELFAKKDVNVLAGAQFDAVSSGAGEDGGDIEIGTTDGSLNFASGTIKMNLQGGTGGAGGTVLLRAPRTGPVDAETDVAINRLDGAGNKVAANALGSVEISGARALSVEAVKVYKDITTLTAAVDSPGNLSLDRITNDNALFAGNDPLNPGANHAAIKARLGKPDIRILSGVEVRSTGDLTLGNDWNLVTSRANGEAGVLTLRAEGDLLLNSNLSDGFSHVTPCTTATCVATNPIPATLQTGDSWSYRLIAGAAKGAADPLAVTRHSSGGNLTVAAKKVVRTGTGDIRLAAGGNIGMGAEAVIYTAGRRSGALNGFTELDSATTPPNKKAYEQYSEAGGDVRLAALGNITGVASTQLFNEWLFRRGNLGADGSYVEQPAWWVRYDKFKQGVGALGGGDVTIKAGLTVKNLSASTPSQARMASSTPDGTALTKTGGGTVRVEAGDDLLGGQYYADRGQVVLKAGGKIDSGKDDPTLGKPLYTIIALSDAQAKIQADQAVNIHAVLNPHMLPQLESGSNNSAFNLSLNNAAVRKTFFSSYTAATSVSVESLAGKVILHDALHPSEGLKDIYPDILKKVSADAMGSEFVSYLPPSLALAAFQGNVVVDGTHVMQASPRGGLDLLAQESVLFGAGSSLIMSDRDQSVLPSVQRPVPGDRVADIAIIDEEKLHASKPVHTANAIPGRIYAVEGDIQGVAQPSGGGTRIVLPKAIRVRAGQDVSDLSIEAQHPNLSDISSVVAGRDILFTSHSDRTEADKVWIGGPGRLEVTAGRNLDLGTSGGIISKGTLQNNNLPRGGAAIHLEAGVGAQGVDYTGAVDRLLAKLEAGGPDDAALWQARWLTGDSTLTAANAVTAVRAVDALSHDAQRDRVRDMLFIALRETGRDSNKKGSPFAGDYARGYAALETVFPGISDKNPDGSAKNYQGEMNFFASRVKTEQGGNIEFMLPGGGLTVGLPNTPGVLVNDVKDALGIVTVAEGDIKGFSYGDILVNQSRILTVSGGDILLWSSEGDIDAGKGKKTATAVAPPIIRVDEKGNVTQELQGAASGSGIGALFTAGIPPGDVDLIAPKGTVNAGDAGIRAGNLNIAAQVVLGAENISVSGTSTGTPVADTSAVSAASSGASNADGGVSSAGKALSQGLSDAARVAEELKQSFKPTFISAEVIGHGDCEPGEKPPCKKN